MQKNMGLILIVLFAALIRLPLLNILPPGGENTFFPRLVTVVTAIVSILLFYLVILQKSRQKDLASVSAFVLTFLPWHIEQSRIYSPFMLILTFLLMVVLLWQIAACKRCKSVLVIFSSIVIWRLLPDLWIFHPPYILPNLTNILQHIFKLLSVDFLFFNNDSLWFGGLRTTGVFLPSGIIIFLLGIGVVAKNFSQKYLWILLSVLILTLLTALDPEFPETRIFFLTTPALAYIAAQGILYLRKAYREKKWFAKAVIIFYATILFYEHVLFFHTYTTHYVNRFAHDIPYEERTY